MENENKKVEFIKSLKEYVDTLNYEIEDYCDAVDATRSGDILDSVESILGLIERDKGSGALTEGEQNTISKKCMAIKHRVEGNRKERSVYCVLALLFIAAVCVVTPWPATPFVGVILVGIATMKVIPDAMRRPDYECMMAMKGIGTGMSKYIDSVGVTIKQGLSSEQTAETASQSRKNSRQVTPDLPVAQKAQGAGDNLPEGMVRGGEPPHSANSFKQSVVVTAPKQNLRKAQISAVVGKENTGSGPKA